MFQTRYTLRLCYKNNKLLRKFNHVKATIASENIENANKNVQSNNFDDIYEKYKDKIIFNSHLESEKLKLGYYRHYINTLKKAKNQVAKELEIKSLQPLPVSLKYFVDKDRLLKDEDETVLVEPDKLFQLPFGNTTEINTSDDTETTKQINIQTSESIENPDIDKWMTAYEHYDDRCLHEEHNELNDSDWSKLYGTPDPNSRVSRVPCGGCGALLHCSDPAIPGYIPSEIFNGRTNEELQTIECQRCHFLKEYNIALDVTVQPEEYIQLLKSIR